MENSGKNAKHIKNQLTIIMLSCNMRGSCLIKPYVVRFVERRNMILELGEFEIKGT